MTPTAAEIVAATLTAPHRRAQNDNEHKNEAALSASALQSASEATQPPLPIPQPHPAPPRPARPARPPDINSIKVEGSEIPMLMLTPESIAEAYKRAVRNEEKKLPEEPITLLTILKAGKSFRDNILLIVGKFLSFILHLDMHGGDTGNNANFVQGLIDFIAGSLGGAAQVYVSQPLDTIKVKLQTFPEKYKGMFHCFISTYRNDGFMNGLYAGSVPAVVANVAENSVLFAAYGGCQKFVSYLVGKELVSELTITQNACAGSLAACFSTLTLCPTELIKCKLQALREMKHFVEPTQASDVRTPWTLTRYIWRTEGIRGFYRGLSSTFIREMPGYFFFFGSYEGTRELLRGQNQTKDEIGAFKTMFAGAIGGVCLWTSTFPADVIKSRIQVKNLNEGMFQVGADIVRREGILALYRGLLPSVLRTIPATATLFVVYEYTKKALLGAI